MCEPVSIALGVVTAVTAAYGAYSQQKAQSNQAKFAASQAERNSQIAKNQAAVMEISAQREEEYARQAAKQVREKGRRLNASNRAQLANSGIDFSGSAYDVFDQNVTTTELDAQRTEDQGSVNAYNKRVQGTSYQNDAVGFQQQRDFQNARTGIDYLSIGVSAVGSGVGAYQSAGGTFGTTSTTSSSFSQSGPYRDGYKYPQFSGNGY